jgi:hypothetical protein
MHACCCIKTIRQPSIGAILSVSAGVYLYIGDGEEEINTLHKMKFLLPMQLFFATIGSNMLIFSRKPIPVVISLIHFFVRRSREPGLLENRLTFSIQAKPKQPDTQTTHHKTNNNIACIPLIL